MDPTQLIIVVVAAVVVIVVVAVVLTRGRKPKSHADGPTSLIAFEDVGNVRVMRPGEDLDLTDMTDDRIRAIGEHLRAAVSACGERQVVLDMTRIQHISSATLGVFIILNETLRANGRRLNLAAVQPPIAKILEITKLDKVLGIYPSVDDAVARLSNPVPA